MRTLKAIPLILLFLLIAGVAGARPKPGQNEPVGDWSFTTDKAIKVIVIGGSVSEFNRGYSDWIGRTCSNVEVVNEAKARYGSAAIGKRFEAQVLKNPNVDLKAPGITYWIVLQGGLNNIWEPTQVNYDFMKLFQTAHANGINVLGLSLSPWGSDKDKRWVGVEAIRNQDRTRLCVDWMLGRLTPAQALGKLASGKTSWKKQDLPDVAVELYDTELRDTKAALRSAEDIERQIDSDKEITKYLSSLPAEKRKVERDRIVKQGVEIPRWFLRPELKSFDHIHPNREGHRIIVETACPKLPAEWGCDCEFIKNPGKGSK